VKSAVSVTAQVTPAPEIGAPAFAVCPDASGQTCTIGGLRAGQADTLEATVPVGADAAPGELVEFTTQASASGVSGHSGTVTDVVAHAAAGTRTAQGALLTPGTLPPIPGTGVSATDPSGLFPTVAPDGPGTGTADQPAPSATTALAARTDAADSPAGNRQILVQLVGLAALLAAVLTATVRVSPRRRRITGEPEQPAPGPGPGR
jgi:hypothetical protein